MAGAMNGLALHGGVVLQMGAMNEVLEIDLPNLCIVVQPGIFTWDVSVALEPLGYYYAPDPSSQSICSIGGNVAFNSGGAHCLKYGFTTNHVLGVRIVLHDGKVVDVARKMGRKNVRTDEPTEKVDNKVREVVIEVPTKPELVVGLRVRATVSNRAMAGATGIDTKKTDRLTFAIGCGIAGVAGAAFTTIGSTGPTSGQLYIVDSFLVVTFGGAASLLGTVVSAFGIAQTQSLAEFFMHGSMAKVLTLTLIVLILMMRPQGLFASKVRR